MSKCKMFFLGGVALTASVIYFGQSADNAALACPSSPYLGSVCHFGGNFCPQGFVVANGGLLTIQGNEALYSVLGTTYGGDGSTNFAVPDLRGRVTIGAGGGPGLTNRVQGLVVGADRITLTAATMPMHTHAATFAGQAAPVSVAVTQPVNTVAGTSAVPGTGTPYLGAASGSPTAAKKLWATSAGTSPVNVGGVNVTVSALPPLSGGASVVNGNFGNPSPTAVPIYGPQIGMIPCIATVGTYPVRY